MDHELDRVVDALPGLVWTALPDGRVEFVNRRWHEYSGSIAGESVDAAWRSSIHPQDLPRWIEGWRSVSAAIPIWELELRLRRSDGAYRWFLCRASPLTDDSGRIVGWCGINTDIDDRRRAETELHAIETNYSEFVRGFPGLVVTMDMTGRIELFSSELLEYFGKTREDLRTWSTNDAVHPDDLPRVIAAFSESVSTGNPYCVEHRCRRADGIYRWFQVRALAVRGGDGEITGWYVVLTDIDDLKRAEEAIRASERALTLIVNTIPALVWSAAADGRAEFFDQHYLDFTGLTDEQASDWGWMSSVHPDDMNELMAAWMRVRASEARGEIEARLRRHDGVYRWFLVRVNPLRDAQGTVVKWYGINTDIEDRKRAEEALNRARSELAHVARITTLSALTASIAHEVNQPLSGIITNASTCLRMLDANPPNVDGARETARRTLRDGNRASDVITRLRALFSRKDFTFESLDLNEAVQEVIALSSGDLRRHGVELRLELANDLPGVTGDRVQLQQVILNLLRNALDAMAELHERPRHLSIVTEPDGEEVRVTVRDAGVGVEHGSLDKLFDAFYTTKSEGMGVGLSVSRSIIESHRGRIWATPNDDAGATFAFSIPSGAKHPSIGVGAPRGETTAP